MSTLPEGSLIKISFEMRLPVDATENQVNEWARYAICQSGGCSLKNPLVNHGPDEWANSFEWEDTGMIGTCEKFDVVDLPDGGSRYKLRYHRTRRAALQKAQS